MPTAVYSTAMLKEANAQRFESMTGKLQSPLLRALEEMGYEYMTPVQSKVLSGLPNLYSDCLVQAKTGTGKTIAFLLPALQSLLTGPPLPNGQVGILIMAPARELALQIAKECDQLTPFLPKRIECHTAFGGTARATNLKRFMTGNPSVLVATPGRLNDYLSEANVRAKFANIRTLILDEADTMLDQGFLGAITSTLQQLPRKSTGWQGMCFSATIPDKIQNVISCILSPGYTRMSTINADEPPTVDKVPQFSVVVGSVKDTFVALLALIQAEYKRDTTNFKIIVFGTTANGVALLASIFENLNSSRPLLPGLKVYQLHSRLGQPARTRTTDQFKVATSGVLFASDVVGRGMDFPNVGVVIQVGLPSSGEQYVHRVGRTARAGMDGRAVILLTDAEAYFLKVNKQLPIAPYQHNILADVASTSLAIVDSCTHVPEEVKRKAYSAWMGFNKTFMKQLRMTPEGLVQMANDYAEAMGCPEPPPMEKSTVAKMGLKGVKGIRYARPGEIEKPARHGRPARDREHGMADQMENGRLDGGPKRNRKRQPAEDWTATESVGRRVVRR